MKMVVRLSSNSQRQRWQGRAAPPFMQQRCLLPSLHPPLSLPCSIHTLTACGSGLSCVCLLQRSAAVGSPSLFTPSLVSASSTECRASPPSPPLLPQQHCTIHQGIANVLVSGLQCNSALSLAFRPDQLPSTGQHPQLPAASAPQLIAPAYVRWIQQLPTGASASVIPAACSAG